MVVLPNHLDQQECSLFDEIEDLTDFTIFWDIIPCSPVIVNGRFLGPYDLPLQAARNEHEAGKKQSSFTRLHGIKPQKIKMYSHHSDRSTCCFMHVSCLAYSSALKLEAPYSSETSVDFHRATRRCMSDDRKLRCSISFEKKNVMRLSVYLKYVGESISKLKMDIELKQIRVLI
jgi:hypothetical protein